MKTIAIVDALNRLVDSNNSCIGAVFLTYTFDAIFFEEEVLAAVLPLLEDPVDNARQFFDEGRRKLVEIPVLVIADPSMLRGGQRLPYDLIRANPARLFHPKLALFLYRSDARLIIGSGNLTSGGYGDNAELSAALTLDYSEDANLIRHIVSFIESSGARGEAWSRFQKELLPRLGSAQEPDTGPPWLLHTYNQTPILDSFLARLSPDAKIERIGVLAPFHQDDEAPPDNAVFDHILDATEGRRAKGFVLDIGVSWYGNSVASSGEKPQDLDAHIGELWGAVSGAKGKESTSWFVLGNHDGHSFKFDDGRAGGWRSTREINKLCSDGNAWLCGQIEVFAPKGLIDRAARRASVHTWLFPEVHRSEGRVYRQPLHGKLITVAVTENRKKLTHLLIGSPNASSAALLRSDANVECAMHLVADGHHHIGLLCTGLVLAPRGQLVFSDRSYQTFAPSPARWVLDAVFDAKERRVRVTWQSGAPRLILAYQTAERRVLFDGVPDVVSVFEEFELDPACCELEVTDPDDSIAARVPLRIEHVCDLPVTDISDDLDLQELILLHSGRCTPAGIASRRSAFLEAYAGDTSSDSAAVFGTTLSPREIFRVILSIGNELSQVKSLGAFEARLFGHWGVRKLAERIVDAPNRGELIRAEAWIYAQELARKLTQLEFDGDPMATSKATLRDEVVSWIEENVQKPALETPGMPELQKFYEAAT